MLADDLKAAEVRAAALAAKPITINSALDRKQSTGPITPTVNRAAPEPERDGEEAEQPWMDEEREAAMKAAMEVEDAQREASAAPNRRQAEKQETLDGGPLPALEDMVAQVPAELQEAMDDLFRAKFQTVKRVPKAVLKE
ncbi:MAG: hypothetical protein SynsKO_02050 [Synoicihabitans sp.]